MPSPIMETLWQAKRIGIAREKAYQLILGVYGDVVSVTDLQAAVTRVYFNDD